MSNENEETNTCARCGETEDNMNHHADYSMDGSWWHNKDHDFIPRKDAP